MNTMNNHEHHHHNHDLASMNSENTTQPISWQLSDSAVTSDLLGNTMDNSHSLHHNHGVNHDHSGHAMHESDGSGHSSHMDHMMSMSFHFGFVETILFSFWKIDNIAGLLGSMVGIFLMSMLYEGLKVLREYLLQRSLQLDGVALNSGAAMSHSTGSGASNGLRVPLAGEGDSGPDAVMAVKSYYRPNPLSWWHALQTMLHMLQMAVSYLLMLIFMTYNVWLCLAVVLGAGCGYYAFGWRKRTIVDINEHCH